MSHFIRLRRRAICPAGEKKVSYRRPLSPFFGQVRKIKDQYRDEISKQAFSQSSNASKVRVRSLKLSAHCANFQSFALRNRSKKKVSYRRRLSPFFGQVRKIKDQRRNERSKQAFSQGSNASKVRVRSHKLSVHCANFQSFALRNRSKKKVSYRRPLSPFFGQVRKIKDQRRNERSKQAFSQGSNASKVRVRSHKLSVPCANFQSFALRNGSKKEGLR